MMGCSLPKFTEYIVFESVIRYLIKCHEHWTGFKEDFKMVQISKGVQPRNKT